MNFMTRVVTAMRAGYIAFRRTATQVRTTLLPRSRMDYLAEIGQGLNSPAVLACLKWISRNWVEAPLRVRIRDNDPTTEPEDIVPSDTGPGAMLALWERPNSFYTGRTMEKALVIDYVSMGNAYIYKRRNASGRVMELWWLPQLMVRPRWPQDDETVFISHYEYNPNGIPYAIDPADIVHLRDGMDPLNARLGLSSIGALAREVFTDDEAANFSAAVLANFGPPGVVISPKEANSPQIAEPEVVKLKFMESFGGDRRGEPMVMTGATSVDVVSWNPEQMQLKTLRRLPEERITAVLGIPAIVAGLGAGLDRSTYANYAEARGAGYEEGIMPGHADWSEQLKWQLLSEWADPLRYEVDRDYSKVHALAEDMTAVWTRYLDAYKAAAITRRTFKDAVNIPADDADDVYAVPFNISITPEGEEVTETPEAPGAPEAESESPLGAPAASNGHSTTPIGATTPIAA